MNDNLKPCPFCGGEAYIDRDKCSDGTPCYQIICMGRNCNVHIKTEWRETEKEVVDIWNRRVKNETN